MSNHLDIKQIIFTNLQLLGLDVGAMEAQHKVPFNKNMFDLPNKRGAEIVLYFLFNKLNPVMCREEFRNCWPVTDKSGEQQFRRTCHNWLTNIAKSEPDANLPRIVASLFMSPGGDKFCNVLFHFSGYVLSHVFHADHGVKDFEHLRHPQLSKQNASLGDVIAKHTQCAVVRKRKQYLEGSQIILVLNKEWKDYSAELVKEYRKLSKDIREVEHRIRVQQQRAVANRSAKGSAPVRRRSNSYDYQLDSQSVKRTHKVQQVRDMWKQLNDFCGREAEEREVIESIVDRTLTQHKIDAREINVKVPDLLLRECQQEIRRRHVDNTFHSGKLNLVSLIQLWNLCLHLYIERLHQDGVPDFTDELSGVSKLVHTNHAYLSNSKTLKKQISDTLPELQKSVDKLRATMDAKIFKDTTPTSIRTTSIGLGLVEPSPSVSFTPVLGSTGVTPNLKVIQRSPDNMPTPEAADRIIEGLASQVKRDPVKLFQGCPEYAPRSNMSATSSGAASNKSSRSTKLPRKRAPPPGHRQQLQSTPTEEVKTMSRTKSARSVDVRHRVHRAERNARSGSPEFSPNSRSGRSDKSVKSPQVLSPVELRHNDVSPRRKHEMSPSDAIVNNILSDMSEEISPEKHEHYNLKNKQILLDDSLGSRSSRSIRSEHSQASCGVDHSKTDSPRSQWSSHAPKTGQSPRANDSFVSYHSEHSSRTLVNSVLSSVNGNESSSSQKLGNSLNFTQNSVESKHSRNSSQSHTLSLKDQVEEKPLDCESPRLSGSFHSHISDSQRSEKSGVSLPSHQKNQSGIEISLPANVPQIESPTSVASDLSRPSGIFEDVDDNLQILSAQINPQEGEKIDKSLGSSGSGSVYQSRNRTDSFTLEQPNFMSTQSHDPLIDIQDHKVTDKQEQPPVTETLDDLDLIKQKLEELKAKANLGLASNRNKMSNTFLLGDAGQAQASQNLSDSLRSEPTQTSRTGNSLSAPAQIVSLMDDKSMLSLAKSPASPLTKEVRSMWKDLLMDTENKSPRATPRSRQSLSRSFSNITEQMEGFSFKNDPDLNQFDADSVKKPNIQTSRNDSHVTDLYEDMENLEDIELPDLSLVDMDDMAPIPQIPSCLSNDHSAGIGDMGISNINILKSGSLGNKVHSKPAQTNVGAFESNEEMLISLTPLKPMTEGTGKYPLVELSNENNSVEVHSSLLDLSADRLQQSVDSEIHFNFKSPGLEKSVKDLENLFGRSLEEENLTVSKLGTSPFLTEDELSNRKKLSGTGLDYSGSLQGQPWGIVHDDEQGLDDIEILDVELDDSFVPFKEGFKFEGRSPMK